MSQVSSEKQSGAYPAKRRARRVLERQRMQQRVQFPIQEWTLAGSPIQLGRTSFGSSSLAWLGLVIGSLFLHGAFVAGSFLVGVALGQGKGRIEQSVVKLTVAIADPPPPPAPPPLPEPPRQTPRPERPRVQAEPVAEPEPEKEPEKPAPPTGDPIDLPTEPKAAPPSAEAPRRIVGLSLESTVIGGSGPAFAVGNSRMGQTARVANTPAKIPALPKPEEVGESFESPKRLREISPPYPPALKEKGIEGEVELSVDIDDQGTVTAVRVIGAPDHQEFAEMAVEAAKKSMYSPAKRRGVAVAYTIQFTVRFRITEERG